MDARLSEFVSAGEARGNAFGAPATRHAWNSAPCRGGGPYGITRPRQRGGGGQPGRREQPSPVAMFPPGQIHSPTGPSLIHVRLCCVCGVLHFVYMCICTLVLSICYAYYAEGHCLPPQYFHNQEAASYIAFKRPRNAK